MPQNKHMSAAPKKFGYHLAQVPFKISFAITNCKAGIAKVTFLGWTAYLEEGNGPPDLVSVQLGTVSILSNERPLFSAILLYFALGAT